MKWNLYASIDCLPWKDVCRMLMKEAAKEIKLPAENLTKIDSDCSLLSLPLFFLLQSVFFL